MLARMCRTRKEGGEKKRREKRIIPHAKRLIRIESFRSMRHSKYMKNICTHIGHDSAGVTTLGVFAQPVKVSQVSFGRLRLQHPSRNPVVMMTSISEPIGNSQMRQEDTSDQACSIPRRIRRL